MAYQNDAAKETNPQSGLNFSEAAKSLLADDKQELAPNALSSVVHAMRFR